MMLWKISFSFPPQRGWPGVISGCKAVWLRNEKQPLSFRFRIKERGTAANGSGRLPLQGQE